MPGAHGKEGVPYHMHKLRGSHESVRMVRKAQRYCYDAGNKDHSKRRKGQKGRCCSGRFKRAEEEDAYAKVRNGCPKGGPSDRTSRESPRTGEDERGHDVWIWGRHGHGRRLLRVVCIVFQK